MNRWDERYGGAEFAYGTEPNDFLVEMAGHIPPGRVLCLAEGEGRNAVYLAMRGHQVTAVDQSVKGMEKAAALAAERGVTVDMVVADLADHDMGTSSWDGIVSIFGHLPPPLRRRVHGACVRALRPGGVLLLEAFTPEQIELGTGGPPDVELTMTLEGLREEFAGLDFLHAVERHREIHEGSFHFGRSAVVQILARKSPEEPLFPRSHHG